MNFMLLTSRAILSDFLWNIHLNHDQLCIKKTYILLYFFAKQVSLPTMLFRFTLIRPKVF
jgi:hypothetical protein